jgi:hypothetical protein
LRSLSQEAARLRRSGKDQKWQRLSETLDLPDMFDANKNRRKLVLFSEHRDTLNYLTEKLADRLGNQNAVVTRRHEQFLATFPLATSATVVAMAS